MRLAKKRHSNSLQLVAYQKRLLVANLVLDAIKLFHCKLPKHKNNRKKT